MGDKLDKGHYYELLDRTYIAGCYIDTVFEDHPMLEKFPRLRELHETITDSLAEMYLQVGDMDEDEATAYQGLWKVLRGQRSGYSIWEMATNTNR